MARGDKPSEGGSSRFRVPERRTGLPGATRWIVIGVAVAWIAGVVAVKFIGGFGSGGSSAHVQTARETIASYEKPLTTYWKTVGRFPATEQGLAALKWRPDDVPQDVWKGPYVESVTLDPWDHAYRYSYPGKHNPGSYDLWSTGPDGISGNADDIGNWKD